MFWEFASTQVAPAVDATEHPLRDDVGDHSRGDVEGESREEEKSEAHRKQQHPSDVSMFSTLTELLLNPFLDGYCKTPFCTDADYFPPSCPSGGYYYTTPPSYSVRQPVASGDEWGDINQNNSGASSTTGSHGKRRRQRPLALAVGYGNDWKDMDGRRVVITPSSPRHSPPYSQYGHCTCAVPPASTNSLVAREQGAQGDTSPHQTKSVFCKFCSSRLQEQLDVPASRSSGTLSSKSQKAHC